MGPRKFLHQLLEQITTNVYFQPPTNVLLVYPCIVYNRDQSDTKFADNSSYNHMHRYMVTVIDRNPDSPLPDKVGAMQYSSFNRFYVVDNLNHDVYSVYF